MKALIIPLLVLLASCGSTHKIVTSKKTTLDSSSTVIRDTAHVSRETSSSDNLNVQNVHIRVEYAADTALAKALQKATNKEGFWDSGPPTSESMDEGYHKAVSPTPSKASKIAQAIKDAIAAGGGNGRLPSSVEIDIGSIDQNSTQNTKSDSGASHSAAQTNLKKTESDKSKDVTRTGLSIGVKIGIGIFLLILLVIVAWRLYQKFKPI